MNWRYQVGHGVARLREFVLSRRWFPLHRAVPWGVVWPYDVARMAGSAKPAVLFDVGANIGQTAQLLHRFFPTAIIHCFEPVPATFALLRKNVTNLAGMRLHPVALGAEPGAARMTLRPDSETNTFATASTDGESCSVDVQTVDAVCAREGIAGIDILKIDVEGHELAVLRGAARLLESGRIRCVYAEVGLEEHDAVHTPFEAVRAHLMARGFCFGGLYECWRHPGNRGRIAFANALFWHATMTSAAAPRRE